MGAVAVSPCESWPAVTTTRPSPHDKRRSDEPQAGLLYEQARVVVGDRALGVGPVVWVVSHSGTFVG